MDCSSIKKKTRKGAKKVRITTLHVDIMINILLRLRVKPLMRCKSVCKLWRDTINSCYFVNQHRTSSASKESQLIFFKQSEEATCTSKAYAVNFKVSRNTFTLSEHPISEFPNGVTLAQNLGHGLFYFRGDPESSSFLYNPMRGEKLILPPPTISEKTGVVNYAFRRHGLGFNNSTKQYKLVRLTQAGMCNPFREEIVTEVYVLGSNKWRQIASASPCAVVDMVPVMPAYGDVHWHVENIIVSFMFTKEEYKVTPLPDGIAFDCILFNWREEMAMLHTISGTLDFNMWLLRDYNDDSTRWEKLYALQYPKGRMKYLEIGTWEEGILLDVFETTCMRIDKMFGKDRRKLCHFNPSKGELISLMANRSLSSSTAARVYERFYTYQVNLDSLAKYSVGQDEAEDSTQTAS